MKTILQIFVSIIVLSLCSCSKDPAINSSAKLLTIKAVDASLLPSVRLSGILTMNSNGRSEDMLTTLKSAGVNTIRLRLLKRPLDGLSSLDEVKRLSEEIKGRGMKVWLTVHYSDTWADPGKQTKPAEWNAASFAQLEDSVYNYTRKIVTEINPDYIQIGNEINNGFLWPDGNYTNLSQFTDLLKQGIKAVRENAAQTKIMLHYAGVDNAVAFFNNFKALDFDMIGLSYYPYRHGKSLDNVQTQLTALNNSFNKDIVIAETAYPFTFGFNDHSDNIIGTQDQILQAYPATEQGQKDYLSKIKQIVLSTPRGTGFCYWGAEWIAYRGMNAYDGAGSPWENQALWNYSNHAVPAMEVFKD